MRDERTLMWIDVLTWHTDADAERWGAPRGEGVAAPVNGRWPGPQLSQSLHLHTWGTLLVYKLYARTCEARSALTRRAHIGRPRISAGAAALATHMLQNDMVREERSAERPAAVGRH